ncbi:MAG: hypothetical protein IPF68_18290 [Bacteroidales bacterium]|nr:hypothetical protein [Bacteroidales bacterium]
MFGKQWVFDNAFSVDIYSGVGYGFSTSEGSVTYHYGYTIADNSFPIAVSGGLKSAGCLNSLNTSAFQILTGSQWGLLISKKKG